MTKNEALKKQFDPVFTAINDLLAKQEYVTVAIDGPSGAGKSLLGQLIKGSYDCNIFHMDDFFLQDHQRTIQRLEEVGGNIDYERFTKEVIEKIKGQEDFSYRVFDCKTGDFSHSVRVSPKKLNIIEGVYSSHPLWYDILDLKVFLSIDKEKQEQRILSRNGPQMLERFKREWIPLEDKFFTALSTAKKFDIVIDS
ncbi:MAG: uridine kinase [Clostridia bacterium]|nr:uridine kinase [Clostridia bacterium]